MENILSLEIFNIWEGNLLRILIVIFLYLGVQSFIKDILQNFVKMLYFSYKKKKLIRTLSNFIIGFLVLRSFVELHFVYALILTPIFILLFSFWSLFFEMLIESFLEKKSVPTEEKKSKQRLVVFMLVVNIFFAFLAGILFYFFPVLISLRFNITIAQAFVLLGIFSAIKKIVLSLSNMFGVNTIINLFRFIFFFAFVLNVFSHFSIIISIILSSIWLGFLILLPNGWKTFFFIKRETLRYEQTDSRNYEESKEYMYKLFGHLALSTLSFIIFSYSVIHILLI